MDPITIISTVVSLIKLLTGGQKLNHEAEVESAIRMVERKVGLTHDVKWAWNWYDWRYKDELGKADEVWDGNNFCNYAGYTINWWEDLAHFQDVLKKTTARIQFYLEEAMYKYQLEHPDELGYEPEGIIEFLKKNAKYLVLGGTALALIAVLVTPRRK
ncbi:MAG: hypothetical protein HWN68_14555 [Desulfobacterales bacterium]|nr:hypothetical protein [Desulfobacterales bacterium]